MTPISSKNTIWQTLESSEESEYFDDVGDVFRMDVPIKAGKAAATRAAAFISVLDISE
jgi:hypothetical protein